MGTVPRAAVAIATLAFPVLAPTTTFTVGTTADSGPGSLRQAILDANTAQVSGQTACAPHLIVFAIPGAGTQTIRPLSPLPVIDIAIDFNGFSQPGTVENSQSQGSNAVLRIVIDGSLAGPTDAFVLRTPVPGVVGCGGSGSVFRGLVVDRWQGAAISVGETPCPPAANCPGGGVRTFGNHIGTDPAGLVAAGNGIALGRPTLSFGRGSTFNIVGEQVTSDGGATTPTPFLRNAISGGGSHAILIASPVAAQPSIDHRIRNNFIGLNAQGTGMLPNAGDGVRLGAGASSTQVADNLIAGNAGSGIRIDAGAVGIHSLLGKGIGIGVGGVAAGNGGNGIRIEGPSGTATIVRPYAFNTGSAASISGNAGAGLASFTRSTPFLPAGRFLAALTRRFTPVAGGGSALVVSEFSNCIPIIALTPLTFANGFEP